MIWWKKYHCYRGIVKTLFFAESVQILVFQNSEVLCLNFLRKIFVVWVMNVWEIEHIEQKILLILEKSLLDRIMKIKG